jgi:hypothetical protein
LIDIEPITSPSRKIGIAMHQRVAAGAAGERAVTGIHRLSTGERMLRPVGEQGDGEIRETLFDTLGRQARSA